MEITEQLLADGASERGGFSKQQLALLGVNWPPSRGWKQAVVGTSIPDDNAEKFISLANSHLKHGGGNSTQPVNWSGLPDPVDIHLYVLALTDGCYYVGLTSDVGKRVDQHFSGEGAEWTKLHAPVDVIRAIPTGTQDDRAAKRMEDAVTVELMLRHGIDKVRGGHFSYPDQVLVESHLRGRGFWERIKQAELVRRASDTRANWGEALDRLIELAVTYYDEGAPADQHDAVFAACFALTRYRFWHEDFAPGLTWPFWNRKGILPVLLSFKLGRPVGSRLATPYEVLAAALSRRTNGKHPLRRLFLLAWKAYAPQVTDNQAAAVTRFMEYLTDKSDVEHGYDAFVSVLLPETRYLLRQKE